MISVDTMSLKQREHSNIHNVPIKSTPEQKLKELNIISN